MREQISMNQKLDGTSILSIKTLSELFATVNVTLSNGESVNKYALGKNPQPMPISGDAKILDQSVVGYPYGIVLPDGRTITESQIEFFTISGENELFVAFYGVPRTHWQGNISAGDGWRDEDGVFYEFSPRRSNQSSGGMLIIDGWEIDPAVYRPRFTEKAAKKFAKRNPKFAKFIVTE